MLKQRTNLIFLASLLFNSFLLFGAATIEKDCEFKIAGQKETIVIVDAYSAGKDLPSEAYRGGYHVIHIDSGYMEAPLRHTLPQRNPQKEHLSLSGLTVDEVANKLAQHNVIAVIPGFESGVQFTDELSQRLQTPHINQHDTIEGQTKRSKYLMSKALEKAGLDYTLSFKTESLEEALGWRKRNLKNWPVVLKPDESVGSDKVFIVYNETEFITAFNKILGSKSKMGPINASVLIQEYLDGPQFILDFVSHSSEHKFVYLWHTSFLGTSEHGHRNAINDHARLINPKTFDEAQVLIDFGQKVLDAVGIAYGPSHLEIRLVDDVPKLVEVAGRMGGGLVELTNAATNRDHTKLVIDTYSSKAKFDAIGEYTQHDEALVVFIANHKEGTRINPSIREKVSQLETYLESIWFFDDGVAMPITHDVNSAITRVHLVGSEADVERDFQTLRKWEENGEFLLP